MTTPNQVVIDAKLSLALAISLPYSPHAVTKMNEWQQQGTNLSAALEELEGVKTAAFALMLKQGKTIPLPTVHLEIPIDAFEHLPQREQIEQFVVIS